MNMAGMLEGQHSMSFFANMRRSGNGKSMSIVTRRLSRLGIRWAGLSSSLFNRTAADVEPGARAASVRAEAGISDLPSGNLGMPAALEAAGHESEVAADAVPAAWNEIAELRKTIQSLRDAMEAIVHRHHEALGRAETAAQAEIAELHRMVKDLRGRMEDAVHKAHEQVQQAEAAAEAEKQQLRATAQALRDELDRGRMQHQAAMEATQRAAAAEMADLHKMIRTLRDQLDERHGDTR